MRPCMVLALAACVSFAAGAIPVISQVVVNGGPSPIPLSTRAGDAYQPSALEQDVRALHATGRFADVRVESISAPEGQRLTFQLTPMPKLMLRKVEIIPDDFPLKARALQGEVVTPARAQSMANEYRRGLVSAGYPDAVVTSELVVVGPSLADVKVHVTAGQRVRVDQVQIDGDTQDLGTDALQSLKTRWLRRPAYSNEAVQTDVARIQSAYISRGYVDAVVRMDHTEIDDGKAIVTLAVRPGRQFSIQEDLCKCLHKDRKEAEALGVVDFSARASIDEFGVFTATATPGRSYTISRIDFEGNRRFSDSSIRRNLLLNEAEVLNIGLLRKSLDRLNKSGMFEPMSESNVDVRTDERTGLAALRIHVRERKAGSWLLSGPVGPVSLAGPARFTLASRLPSWGQRLLDLSSFYASLHLSPGQAVVALQRPFIPGQAWASGFAIAPQLGWKNMVAQYAGTQFRERMLTGESLPAPPIQVTVERADGETVMMCDPPGPRWPWLKRGMSMALQFGSMLAL